VIVVATMVVGTSSGVFATPAHERCVSRHHTCGATERVASCCCGHESDRSTPATTETRTSPTPDIGAATAILPLIALVSPAIVVAPVQTAPLRGSSPDLPTLYATLLI
jgi:hypothetical protein